MGEPRYKALLIGAANYGAPGITPLPFVPDDLERMSAALVARGFHQAAVAQVPLVTPNEVNGEVTRFLGEAEHGDRLLIVLSGHGVHHAGKDYLVPEDIRTELLTFAKGCIEIDWRDEIEESRAEQVVFLIDACREGIERDTKSTSAWSKRKAEAARDRKVAYVYACSPGEYARFVRNEEASFSLFSEAVTDLLLHDPAAAAGTGTLGSFRTALQERIDAFHAEFGKPGRPQRIRVLTETPEDELTLLPPADGPTGDGSSPTERTWTEAATTHPAWQLTAPELTTVVEELRQVCGALVSSYARVCDASADALRHDPWHDEELAQRTTERLGFLLRRLAPGTVLSPTEAALLVLLPYAAQAYWAKQEAERQTREVIVDELLRDFPRLKRRARGLPQASEARWQICRWAYHRLRVQDPAAFTPTPPAEDVPSDKEWVRSELNEHRLLGYLKEQYVSPTSAPGTNRSTDLSDEREVAPSTAAEHTVRERLISALLKAAHALAIDPADLPEILVEHLGIADEVDLYDLFITVRQTQWVASGAGRSLRAECQHPAVQSALRQYTTDVDHLLRELNRLAASGGSLSPLSTLPAYAHAQDVRLTANVPENLKESIRFHVDEERIQELLMGQQLYGDRDLAIRELYQNALDACRYREARTEYLRRTGAVLPPWQGEITFTEAEDQDASGRAYLECADNGIGMGVTELTEAFSRGGARFVDLPEYVEEGALWAALDPPVTLEPVSRFGIGVLSYFMIANEITVWTCRLGRDGRPGRLLKVTVAGPGNLFRVEDLGQGTEAGTRVRLYAAPDDRLPSPGWALGGRLRVADYRVVVRGGEELVCEPGVLSVSADSDHPLPQASPANEVWWQADRGDVLVDGIAAQRSSPEYGQNAVLTGRTVNLHGSRARLSVDRKEIIEYDRDKAHDQCVNAIDDLMGRRDILTHDWLLELHVEDARLADAILDRAVERNLSWDLGWGTLDAGRTGLFPPDLQLLPVTTGFDHPPWPDIRTVCLLVLCLPEPLLRWRLRALLGLPTRMPSIGTPHDLKHFSVGSNVTAADWQRCVKQSMLRISRRGPRETVGELQSLLPWRQEHIPLTAADILDTAFAMDRPVRRAVEQLRALGFRTARLGPLAQATTEDLDVLRIMPHGFGSGIMRTHTSSAPAPSETWLPAGAIVHLAHLLRFEDPVRAAERLAELGQGLPTSAVELVRDWPKRADENRYRVSAALMAHPDALPATPREASCVTAAQLLYAAVTLRVEPTVLARYLAGWGFSVPNDVPAEVSEDQKAVISAVETGTRARDLARSDVERRLLRHSSLFPQGVEPRHVRALAELGFSLSDSRGSALELINVFNQDSADLRHTEAVVTPTVLRVAAEISGVQESDLRAALRDEGVRAPEAHDPAHDKILTLHLAPPTDGTPPTITPGTPLRLAELASAALATGRPFREVAEQATQLGFKHEAEDWFDDA